jgi:PhnB protein
MHADGAGLARVRDELVGFEDPFGHHWDVATHVEDVTPEEMSERAAAITG